MKTKRLKNIALSIFSLFVAATLLVSCSKSNSNPTPANSGKTAKFTITVGGAIQDSPFNDITLIITGGTLKGDNTIWKLNGATQNNAPVVSLTNQNFTGTTKTYVIESVLPLNGDILASLQCLNNSTNTYTVSFTAEINGKVVENDQNVAVSKGHNYTPAGGEFRF
jgi:hypothetical protein